MQRPDLKMQTFLFALKLNAQREKNLFHKGFADLKEVENYTKVECWHHTLNVFIISSIFYDMFMKRFT